MGFTTTNKEGNQSATKWGTVLIGASVVLGTITAASNGNLTAWQTLLALISEVGGTFLALGIRDLPLLNR